MAERHVPAPENRREPRYAVHDQRIHVWIERSVGLEVQRVEAKLLDISNQGAKFRVSECLAFAETVKLHFAAPELSLAFETLGVVCWSRPAENDDWHIGFTVSPKITDEVMTRLASNDYIERRSSARIPVSHAAAATWELEQNEDSVEVVDISAGGFCVASSGAGELGQRMMLHLNESNGARVSLAAQVKWRRVLDDECLVGCALINSQDAQHLRRICLKRQLTAPFLYLAQQAHTRVGYLVATVVLAAVSAGIAAGLADARRQAAPIAMQRTVSHTVPVDRARAIPVSRDADHNDVGPPVFEQSSTVPNVNTDELPTDTINTVTRAEATDQMPAKTSESISLDSKEATARLHDVPSASNQADSASTASEGHRTDTKPSPESAKHHQPRETPARQQGSSGQQRTGSSGKIKRYPRPGSVVSNSSRPALEQQKKRAYARFIEGDRLYRNGEFDEATGAFRDAALLDRENPRYHYMLAMALYSSNRLDVAQQAAHRGARLERNSPVRNWGQLMSRHQGRARVWLEQTRSKSVHSPRK